MERRITSTFVVGTAPEPGLPLKIWTGVAATSVIVASIVAVQPGRMQDLWLVRDWLHYWQTHGDPYPAFNNLDYPPGALLLLWPLNRIQAGTAALVLIPIQIASCAAGAWLLMRWFSRRLDIVMRWQDQATLIALMLAGGSFRSTIWRGQTTPVAFLLGALALYWARQRPWAAAIALGLAAFKPHLAIGFALAILLTESSGAVIVAGLFALSQFVIFSATVEAAPADIFMSYVRNLASLYHGPDHVVGMLGFRMVIESVVDDFWIAFYLHVGLAVGSLAFIISRVRRYLDFTTSTHVAVACLLWSLMFLPQQLYNGILVAPALWLLMWPKAALIARPRIRTAVVTAFVLFGVLDVPRMLRVIADVAGDLEWLTTFALLLPPLRVALLFAFVLYRLAPGGSLLVNPPPRPRLDAPAAVAVRLDARGKKSF